MNVLLRQAIMCSTAQREAFARLTVARSTRNELGQIQAQELQRVAFAWRADRLNIYEAMHPNTCRGYET